jgi:putative flippase GtrA
MKKKYVLYMCFAAICMGVNLGSQFLLSLFLPYIKAFQVTIGKQEISFYLQLFTGTLLGFTAKFLMDKFIVFKEKHENIKHTIKQIIKYGILALFTTIIFWTFEFGFQIFFSFEYRELLGGFIGLTIGYTVKFFLDNKFVFIKKDTQEKLEE